MARATKATPKRQRAFLAELEATASVTQAARAAGVNRNTVYEWRAKNAAFSRDWDEALEFAADSLETEARRRAVAGTDRPVYHAGKVVGTVQHYSDALLMLLLRAARPEKYRERSSVQHEGIASIHITRTIVAGPLEPCNTVQHPATP